MAARQRVVVDSRTGNITVHGRAAAVILFKVEGATPGTFVDISEWALFFEVSGAYRIELLAGDDFYTRRLVLPVDLVQELALTQNLPFAMRDETPVDPRVIWAGQIQAWGFRGQPPGAAYDPGVSADVAGATVTVEGIGSGDPVVIVSYEGPPGPAARAIVITPMWFGDRPAAGEVVELVCPIALTLDAAYFEGSVRNPASLPQTITASVGASVIWTASFAAGATEPVFTIVEPEQPAGVLAIALPIVQDATLGNFALTVGGTRSGA